MKKRKLNVPLLAEHGMAVLVFLYLTRFCETNSRVAWKQLSIQWHTANTILNCKFVSGSHRRKTGYRNRTAVAFHTKLGVTKVKWSAKDKLTRD
jgi:hypothetical protein